MSQNIYPHLFHIGTQKAASTLLYNQLKNHSNVCLSTETEVNFFTGRFERGMDWYLSTFTNAGIRIDTSPKYFMMGKEVAPRIKEYAENYLDTPPKFLLILRNPIDYLFSHYNMQVMQDFFIKHPAKYPTPTESLIDLIMKYPDYLERAKYFKLLNNYWLNFFDISQFKIVFFEDLIRDKDSALRDVLNFFDVPWQDLEVASVSKNQMLKFKFLYKLQSKLIRHVELKNRLKNNRLFNLVYDNLLVDKRKKKLASEERKIIANLLKDDVKKLKQLLNTEAVLWTDFN